MSKSFKTVEVESRKDKRIESVKFLRDNNFIPAVVGGEKLEPVSLKIKQNVWNDLLASKELIFSLKNGEKKELVSIAAIEKSPFGKTIHLAFHRIKRNVKTEVTIPVKLIGERKSSDSAMVQQHINEIKIEAIPTDIPHSVEIDISGFNDGDIIRLKDLKMSKGVELVEADLNEVVVECHFPHVAAEEPTEAVEAVAEVAKTKEE